MIYVLPQSRHAWLAYGPVFKEVVLFSQMTEQEAAG
jgi:hypothetical protein